MPSRSHRSSRWALSTRLFVDEDGSTFLAAMLAVLLAVAMLATGLQWYWVSSSSCDIQSIADLGALAGADAIAKTVSVIQVLDFLLLSMNVMAVVLHVVVIVSGIVVVTSSPVGGASMAPVFQKALEFDRKFISLRKRFAGEAYGIACALSDAAPFLAMGQSYHVINRSSSVLSARTGATYSGVAIPFPIQGNVTLSSMPTNEAALATLAGSTNESNSADARELTELEKKLEEARLDCWQADVYRPPSTPSYGWNPASAVADFERRVESLRKSVPVIDLPDSVGGTAWSEEVLAERYRADYEEIGRAVEAKFSAIAQNHTGTYLDPGSATVGYLIEPSLAESVFLVPHDEGERKAYHSTITCSGLSNAAVLPESTELRQLVGDSDHPPCSLCTPVHWAAIREWMSSLDPFVSYWNVEASHIRNYETIREEMTELQGAVSSRTKDALGQILDSMASYLRGGRLTYRPAGSRGLACVVTSTSSRTLPAFTLPAVTGASGQVLGKQIALAGATLSSGGSGSAAAQAVSKLSTDVGIGKQSTLPGSVLVTLGLSEGVAGAVAPLWRAGVSALQGDAASMRTTFDALPWGLGGTVRSFLDAVIKEAGVSKPDVRQVVPVLASISDIGDPAIDGWEGQLASAVRTARSTYGAASGLADAMAAIVGAGEDIATTSNESLAYIEKYRLMGKQFKVPFDDWSARDGIFAAGYAAGQLSLIQGLR